MTEKPPVVIVVDDDDSFRNFLSRLVSSIGLKTLPFDSAEGQRLVNHDGPRDH